jgi:1-acyl-sn-glycerol-3-phosphate acyltransferase
VTPATVLPGDAAKETPVAPPGAARPSGGEGRRRAGAGPPPGRSATLLGLFARYARWRLAREFRAVRLSREGARPRLEPGPVLVVLNHPSWWDPIACLALLDRLPGRAHAAPIDAAMLERYRFFRRLGFFPVEAGSARGRAAFLREASALLEDPSAALWITAQGRFSDPRERPPRLRPGVGHLARRLRPGTVLPLALEYPAGEAPRPEARLRLGAPLRVEDGRARSAAGWTAAIEGALAATQDALAAEVLRRDPADTETVVDGSSGQGGIYGAWLVLRRWASGGAVPGEARP